MIIGITVINDSVPYSFPMVPPTEIPLLGAAGVNNRPYVLEYLGYTSCTMYYAYYAYDSYYVRVYLYHNELVARYELLILYAYMHIVCTLSYVIYESYVCCVHSRKISKKYSY